MTEPHTYIILPILAIGVTYITNKCHALTNLILIEFMATIAILVIFESATKTLMENFSAIFFLVIIMIESVAGISIIVSVVRTHGNDYMKSSIVIKL